MPSFIIIPSFFIFSILTLTPPKPRAGFLRVKRRMLYAPDKSISDADFPFSYYHIVTGVNIPEPCGAKVKFIKKR